MSFKNINAAANYKKRAGKKCFFYHTYRTNLNKIPIKPIRIEINIKIIKP
jgi:hypothetical protein